MQLHRPEPSTSPDSPSSRDRRLAYWTHCAALFAAVLPLVPIGVYLVCRGRSRFVAHHALRAAVLQPAGLALWFAAEPVARLLAPCHPLVFCAGGLVYGLLVVIYVGVVLRGMEDALSGRQDARLTRFAGRLLAYDDGVPPPV